MPSDGEAEWDTIKGYLSQSTLKLKCPPTQQFIEGYGDTITSQSTLKLKCPPTVGQANLQAAINVAIHSKIEMPSDEMMDFAALVAVGRNPL